MIHRDLAARNILIIDQFTAKISDFGLCCTFDDTTLNYQASAYKKLPMKWLSIEALLQRSFSEKSDVWAFGVLMYEVFTHGEAPYVMLENDEVLGYLKEGKRLPSPEDAPLEIYEIMTKCWDVNIDNRPNFKELVDKLRIMLNNETGAYGYIENQLI